MGRKWQWLGVLMLSYAPLVAAHASPTHATKYCALTRKVIHQTWQRDAYAAPAKVAGLMVAAMDGDTRQVQKGLAALSTKSRQRWQPLVLDNAALAGQTTTVKALIENGADPNATAMIPPLKAHFYQSLVGAAKQDPRFDPKVVKGLKAAGLTQNRNNPIGPPLYATIQCHDAATTRVLLRHGAEPTRQPWFGKAHAQYGADPFMVDLVTGDAAITKLLLDDGVDPCVEDQRITKPHTTVASIGRKKGLPKALVKRLTCHKSHPSGP